MACPTASLKLYPIVRWNKRAPCLNRASNWCSDNWYNHGELSEPSCYTIIVLKSVAVRKLQVAILARSSREMSQTVRIDWQHFLSRVRISVRPSNFFYAKNTQKLSRTPSLAQQVSVEWTSVENNIWPRPTMIIINIIILYFIQIKNTDDSPSKGTRLVLFNAACLCHPFLLG